MLMDVPTVRGDAPAVVEPVCPAVFEAAAIVEAEWIRLRRSSAPVHHASCGLRARLRSRRRVRTVVTTMPTSHPLTAQHGRLRPRRPVGAVWARERSPPIRS
ncbi:hypothetical protein [Mycobacterium sp. IS-1264]|uniref:hypothetical protein n=1 Tax=Mycobacterium sp. IS-1264 TaxID=1834158 RepID=UPI00197BB66A|nr:hypothetical protein [Mycobacterium sp. IS-1264]